jgi:membrane protease YdiL (CAAX protease family)
MEKINFLNKFLWCYPIVVIITQLLPVQFLLPLGIIFLIFGFSKKCRILLLFGFTVLGHLFWMFFFHFLSTFILNEQLLTVLGRFGLIGYIVLFAFWGYFQPQENNYLRLGNIKENIKFPFIWRGFKEYVWRFIFVFGILCSAVIVFLFFNVNRNPILFYGLLFAAINSFLEELIWRGFILGRAIDIIGERQALIITSLSFGFYHLSLGFPTWVCLAFSIGGFFMGGCAIKSKGLFASVTMHFCVNMVFIFYGMIF